MEEELSLLFQNLDQKHNSGFSALKTDEERFSYVLSLAEESESTPKVLIDEKNSKESTRLRNEGNLYFTSKLQKENRDKILELYTKSVAHAEPNSSELAQAFESRSAFLYSVQLYDHCLLDIERALVINKCKDLKAKLLRRRENCLRAIGVTPENAASTSGLEQSTGATRSVNTKKKKSKASKNLRTLPPQRKLFNEEKYMPKLECENSNIAGASNAIEFFYDEQNCGPFLRATRDIEPGEPLCIQNGYSNILFNNLFHKYCSHCLTQVWSAVPCRRCTSVIFCSVDCRKKASESFHDAECGIVKSVISLEDSSTVCFSALRLAVRSLKQAGSFEALKAKIKKIESQKDRSIIDKKRKPSKFDGNDFRNVYTLPTKSEFLSSADLLRVSVRSLIMVYYAAVLTNLFGEKLPCDVKALRKNPWAIFFGGLITKYQHIIRTNLYCLNETIDFKKRRGRGVAILPLLSTFNHSCDVTVTAVFYGTNAVVHALYPIKAGEQIFANYGGDYAVDPFDLRQKHIQNRFHFTCQCRPCREKWPMLSKIAALKNSAVPDEADEGKYTLEGLLIKCPYLNVDNDIKDILTAIEDLKLAVSTFSKKNKRPSEESCMFVRMLRGTYRLISMRWQTLNEQPLEEKPVEEKSSSEKSLDEDSSD